jgi:hypothetical protein
MARPKTPCDATPFVSFIFPAFPPSQKVMMPCSGCLQEAARRWKKNKEQPRFVPVVVRYTMGGKWHLIEPESDMPKVIVL